MLTARSLFHEIRSNDRAYQLLLSVAAKGETQGGWENERIALLTRDRGLAPKIRRHGEDESKHGRLFTALLKKRGLRPSGFRRTSITACFSNRRASGCHMSGCAKTNRSATRTLSATYCTAG